MNELSKYMKFQAEKITRLENLMVELEDKINELKKNKGPSIEKVEYKFDQLKIETLEGTLNIGLTPNGENMLEDFQVENKEISVSQQYTQEMKERIHHHLFQFVNEEGLKHLLELERTYDETFDEKYREMIIDDIRNQIPHRINENYKKIKQKEPSLTNEQLEHAVCASIKNEIITGLQSFVKHKPKGED
ncbi:spore germination protein GerPC [Lottiidibacillus patelloidae]|nr:spore germination protein GerPC [Lottiidibacillus patelloidae]